MMDLFFASVSKDQTVQLMNKDTRRSVETINRHEGDVNGCDMANLADSLISCSDDETVRMWDINNHCRESWKGEHGSEVYGCSFSPDDKTIITCSLNEINIWDVNQKKKSNN